MTCTCGCCEGVHPSIPESTQNLPGLDAVSARVGRYDTFLASMISRLSAKDLPSLGALRTRAPDDATLALLDAGATLLDVLTFYQERWTNEGYLRTATERRSILELARLVGYRLRPGVSASTYLAYTLEKDARLTIPKGSKAQSVPGPGELPQTFETSEDIEARYEWNALTPRQTQPMQHLLPLPDATGGPPWQLYLAGTATGLQAGDPILVEASPPQLYRVLSVEPDTDAGRTLVRVTDWIVSGYSKQITRVIDRARSLAPAGVATSATGQRVLARLKELGDMVEAVDDVRLAELVREKALPELMEERDRAASGGFTRLEPWLNQITKELSASLGAGLPRSGDAGVKPLAEAGGSGLFEFSTAASVGLKTGSQGPAAAGFLTRNLSKDFTASGDLTYGMVGAFEPRLRRILTSLIAGAKVTDQPGLKVYRFRTKANLFGHNAPLRVAYYDPHKVPVLFERTADEIKKYETTLQAVHLDQRYEGLALGSYVVVDTSAVNPAIPATDLHPVGPAQLVARVGSITVSASRAAYGLAGPSTTIDLVDPKTDKPIPWITMQVAGGVILAAAAVEPTDDPIPFTLIRGTVVFAGAEPLPLAEAPIEDCVKDGVGQAIELDRLVTGLSPGRWLILTGERDDIPNTSGVIGTELVMLAGVAQDVARDENRTPIPGESIHTFLTLASKLGYCYVRKSLKIYANVVHATHGETRPETLGGGDATIPFQRFVLKASPLTFTAAATAEGTASSLTVRVNDVAWHERRTLADASPIVHTFVTDTDDAQKMTVFFGDGRTGARLPTGRENVKAVYRSGIGKPGNVASGQISLLASRPLGVKEVINPLASSGGADPDSRDQARENIPIALQALDRLVSVRDYGDFARAFAGVGKALATRLSDGRRQRVHVTIAGLDDIPILESSDLFVNLAAAFHRLGEPALPVTLQLREQILLVVTAVVRIHPDYDWLLVQPKIRAALLDRFGFTRQVLGVGVSSSAVIAAIQAVPGVTAVDLDAFGGIPERVVDGSPPVRRLISPAEVAVRITDILGGAVTDASPACGWPPPFCPVRAQLARIDQGTVAPAQLVVLNPAVPATLALTLKET